MLPDPKAHSPNEDFPIENFEKGIRLNRRLFEEIAGLEQLHQRAGHERGSQAHVQWGKRGRLSRLAVHSATLHHERTAAIGDRAGVQCYFPRPQSAPVGRGHNCLCIGLEEVWGLGPEFDD
jgi:hypothetical protein